MRKKIPNSKFQIPNENGQSLIETLAALAVVIIAILGLVVATTVAIRNASFSRNQTLATKYAQAWIEEARKLRDRQAESNFFTNGSCNASDVTGVFTRTRTCSLASDGKKKTMTVVVTVSWTDARGTYQSKLETRLTNWR
jgi:Tfp pilus assembly protein PilV